MTVVSDKESRFEDESPLNSTSSSTVSTSVLKALQLLDVFRNTPALVGVSEIARMSGIHKSTAFRLLTTLEHGGFVERVGTKYRLSIRVFELGTKVGLCRPQGFRETAVPFLMKLAQETGRTAHLAVLDGDEVVYVAKEQGTASGPLVTSVGERMPATCTALGKALLAFSSKDIVDDVLGSTLIRRTSYSITEPGRLIKNLHQVQVEGYAVDQEEAALGLVCVAIPIILEGELLGALSVSGPTTGYQAQALAEKVRAAGHLLRQELTLSKVA